MRLFGTDLILLHPPSIYDFRKERSEYGPISDVIFSTPVFEMYPMGFTSMAGYLEANGYNARIVNIAQRMVSDRSYDAEAAIAKLDPQLFGIDLHWLPHAQGALKLAEIVKKHHPATPIVFGGLSASYFHEELIRSPFVDYVIRGDSCEEPLRQLLDCLSLGNDKRGVSNLTWKDDGTRNIVVNPLDHVPASISARPVPDISYVIGSVFKYGRLRDVIPYSNWIKYPITALLTSRGCPMQCSVCGGSREAYRKICGRDRPAYRDPADLVSDITFIEKFSRAPIFLIHDLRNGGHAYAHDVLERMRAAPIRNEIVIELTTPVHDDYLERVGDALSRWSLEITLESHVERIRHLNRRFQCSNEEVIQTVRKALGNGVGRIDIFFMVGLPGQSYEDGVEFDGFCRELLERCGGDRRLEFFIAPLAPFVDPGSAAYERPREHGFKLRFHTLDEHLQALKAPSWKEMLNYEIDSMTRDEIAAATYEAMRRLQKLKHECAVTDDASYLEATRKIDASEAAVAAIDVAMRLPPGPEREAAIRSAADTQPDQASIFQKNYLIWPLIKGRRFAGIMSLALIGLSLLLRQIRTFFTWRVPLYFRSRRRERISRRVARLI
ncbi:MAG TPA: TIGR04190 family B12-binding domain/radical SAM domain protein [Pyrinomonadaceae bacterium]|nr:TIGR04190 family B12-binding domain/radical SAM domain protein [Pyrinomonadaceae bacterium]